MKDDFDILIKESLEEEIYFDNSLNINLKNKIIALKSNEKEKLISLWYLPLLSTIITNITVIYYLKILNLNSILLILISLICLLNISLIFSATILALKYGNLKDKFSIKIRKKVKI